MATKITGHTFNHLTGKQVPTLGPDEPCDGACPGNELGDCSHPRTDGEIAEKLDAVDSREGLKSVLGPIRKEHDKHAKLDPSCPFCTGDIT